MSEKKWTPGPWGWYSDDSGSYSFLHQDVGDAKVWSIDRIIGDGSACGEYSPDIDPDSANAHLIAAAPELYDALEEFIEMYVPMINSGDCGNWDPEKEPEVIAARAALAKARGETK